MKAKKTTATAALLGATMALFTPLALGQGSSESAPGQIKKPKPFSPPSGPTQWLFQGPPAESKFLAAISI